MICSLLELVWKVWAQSTKYASNSYSEDHEEGVLFYFIWIARVSVHSCVPKNWDENGNLSRFSLWLCILFFQRGTTLTYTVLSLTKPFPEVILLWHRLSTCLFVLQLEGICLVEGIDSKSSLWTTVTRYRKARLVFSLKEVFPNMITVDCPIFRNELDCVVIQTTKKEKPWTHVENFFNYARFPAN